MKKVNFATAETHFLFKGSFYDQIDGVAMGSPLARVLANLFMGHHEKIWLEQYQGPELLLYRRYVDDTFCLFHSEQDAIAFFAIAFFTSNKCIFSLQTSSWFHSMWKVYLLTFLF